MVSYPVNRFKDFSITFHIPHKEGIPTTDHEMINNAKFGVSVFVVSFPLLSVLMVIQRLYGEQILTLPDTAIY